MSQPLDVDALLRFIDNLGFEVSTHQYIAAQNVLIGLAAHGAWPSDPRLLRTWLAPIICSSPREQEKFYRRFNQWAAQHAPITPGPDPPPPPPPPAAGYKLGRRGRNFILAAVTMLAVVIGFILLSRIPRTLSGQVIDKDSRQPVAAAQVIFGSRNSLTDASGRFAFSYHQTELPQNLTVTREEYETAIQPVASNLPSGLVVELQKVEPPPPPPSSPEPPPDKPSPKVSTDDRVANPAPTIVPIPKLNQKETSPDGVVNARTYWRWIGFSSATLPLAAFGLWCLWQRKLRQALLEKLRTAARPRLEQIVVKGAAGQLFMGQSFRRTIQELRRHRQGGASELDIQRTVDTTIRSGGLFSPRYGARQTLPEYLVLIDRAGFDDQQARLDEEIVRRLIQDNVFVDAYTFHGDPRVCRKADNSLQYVSVQDLAALHPDHNLVIFADGSSFLNPFTGAPERWLEMFSPWAKRAILTPEPTAYWGYREWILADMEFVVLPATQEGLAALSELVDVGATPAIDIDLQARPYPELLREREQRWLEDHEPAEAENLCDELKLFLGSKGYFWLSACAVYPVLHWDLTLYFGFKLFADRTEIEERLLSLVRLPWFRYGTMPEWLRLRLISEMSPGEEQIVRRALEELFLTVLDQPPDGINIEFVSATDRASLRERLRKQIGRWKFKKLLWRFLKDETTESPLRDYVFVAFMAGRKPHKLTVSLPAAIRRLFFPQGQVALGLRTASGLMLALLFSLTLALVTWQLTQPTSATTKSSSQFYLQMSSQEQTQFVRERARQLSQTLDGKAPELSDEAVASIKTYVDYYSYRVGNNSSQPWVEDLCLVFARASQLNAPTIISSFEKRNLSPLLGLYIPMSYTEFLDYQPQDTLDTAGVFQLTELHAARYGISLEDRSDITQAAPAAAEVIDRMRRMLSGYSRFPSVLILSYKRGPYKLRADKYRLFGSRDLEPTCWDFQANANKLDDQFRNDDLNYVLKFFAAAIVGENPKSFGLDMEPLSTYSTLAPPAIDARVAELIDKFRGDERRDASDELVKLYSENKAAVVIGLMNAIQTGDVGENQYRINLYIARTLGSIPAPGWDGTVEQFNLVVTALKTSEEYDDRTFKTWVDKALENFNVKSVIDCDCANLGPGLGQCSKVEADLIQQFRTTGTMTGKCDPEAQGPNAKPSDARPTATPMPSITVALFANPSTVELGKEVTFNTIIQGDSHMRCLFNFGDGQQASTEGCQSVRHLYSMAGVYNASVLAVSSVSSTNRTRASVRVTVLSQAVIPNLVGKSESEVRAMFDPGIFFQVGNVRSEFNDTVAPGTVIRQQPAAGARAPGGTKIDIVVAKFSDSFVTVPDLIGLSVDNARKQLSGLGLRDSVDYDLSDDSRPRSSLRIISQFPKAGTRVKPGIVISISAK